jgi:hypothetical protein
VHDFFGLEVTNIEQYWLTLPNPLNFWTFLTNQTRLTS